MKRDTDGIIIENLNYKIHERVFVKKYNTFGFIVDISGMELFVLKKKEIADQYILT